MQKVSLLDRPWFKRRTLTGSTVGIAEVSYFLKLYSVL